MTHIITGTTGFVGSALALELLMRTDARIVGVVRPNDGCSPLERLRGVLHPLVEGYDLPSSVHDAIDDRVFAVAGDLELPQCGVGADEVHRAGVTGPGDGPEFWHCAASLQFQDRHRAAIERTNIGGTANAVDLADALRAGRFNMVSTAYVAGSRAGLIPADPGDEGLVNNLYERSKIRAEAEVVGRLGSIGGTGRPGRYRILRPSVVIGHSVTAHTTSADGFYGFTRGLRKFARMLDRTQDGLSSHLELRIRADGDGPLDLVPVDQVVADAVGLALADAPTGIYHLTNPTPPTVGQALNAIFDLVGMPSPILTSSTDGFTVVEQRFAQRLDFYSSYLVNAKQFDRDSVRSVLGDRSAPGLVMDPATLTDFGRRYLEWADGHRLAAVR